MPLTLMTRSSSAAGLPGCGGRRGAAGAARRLAALRRHLVRRELSAAPGARRICRSRGRRTDLRSCCSRTRPPPRSSSSLARCVPSCTPRRRASFSRYFWPISMALLALGGVDDVLDLVARARGLDQRQPVLAGLVAGLRQDLDDVAVAAARTAAARCGRSPSRRRRCCRHRSEWRRRNRWAWRPRGSTITRPLRREACRLLPGTGPL